MLKPVSFWLADLHARWLELGCPPLALVERAADRMVAEVGRFTTPDPRPRGGPAYDEPSNPLP
jgi:hypothetical protein